MGGCETRGGGAGWRRCGEELVVPERFGVGDEERLVSREEARCLAVGNCWAVGPNIMFSSLVWAHRRGPYHRHRQVW